MDRKILAKKAVEYLESDEGKEAMKKSMKESQKAIDELKELRKVYPEQLQRHFDI